MILTCPECATSYSTPPGAIGSEGRKVKCRKCAHVWFAREVEAETFDAAPTLTDDADGAFMDDDAGFDAVTADDAGAGESPPDNDDWAAAAAKETNSEPADEADDFAAAMMDVDDDDGANVAGDAPVENYEAIAKSSRVEEKSETRVGIRWPTIVRQVAAAAAMVILAAGSVYAWRYELVSIAPTTARLYAALGAPVNLRGLEFKNVSFERGFEDGVPVLAIHGEVVNVAARPVAVPQLRFALRDDSEREIYYWTGAIGTQRIAPGDTVPFVTRLASPPVTARNIMIRFTGQAPG